MSSNQPLIKLFIFSTISLALFLFLVNFADYFDFEFDKSPRWSIWRYNFDNTSQAEPTEKPLPKDYRPLQYEKKSGLKRLADMDNIRKMNSHVSLSNSVSLV